MRRQLMDLEAIRRELYFTLAQMGERLLAKCSSGRLTSIQPSRVHEWEKGIRSVPLHVIAAYAQVAVEYWRAKRERAGGTGAMEVDDRYSRLINPSIARLLFARDKLRTTSHDTTALEAVEDALNMTFEHYRRLLDVDLSFCLIPPSREQKIMKRARPSRRSPKGIPVRRMS